MSTNALVSKREELFRKLKKDFGGFMTLNWETRLRELIQLNPTEEEKEELSMLMIKYINGAMESGKFGNLEDIQPVMRFLNIDSLMFNEEWVGVIADFMDRFSLCFLYDMSPSLWHGKLRSGEKYEHKNYAKKLIIERGIMPEAVVTDEFVDTLWRIREILVKLHYLQMRRVVGDVRELTGAKVIEMLTARLN